jgi:hypothetical protein
VVGVDCSGPSVQLANGQSVTGDVVIGADGELHNIVPRSAD